MGPIWTIPHHLKSDGVCAAFFVRVSPAQWKSVRGRKWRHFFAVHSLIVEEPTMATPPPSSLYPSTNEEVLNCQFSSWYDTFRDLPLGRKNVTIKSIVLPLPPDFIEFLLSDGIRLPLGATKVSSCAPNEQDGDEDVWSSSTCSENADDHDQEDADSADGPRQYYFPELNRHIEEAIAELGGSVIPKLNWSCPKDATWVNNGTLKCQTPGDVYLLLKSSDFVMHDLLHAIDKEHTTIQYELVLRKWCNLHPSMEFRCFVSDRQLGTC